MFSLTLQPGLFDIKESRPSTLRGLLQRLTASAERRRIADELLELADRNEANSPSYAADLRAGAALLQAQPR